MNPKRFVVEAAIMFAAIMAVHSCATEAHAKQRVWVCSAPVPLEQGSGTVKVCRWVEK